MDLWWVLDTLRNHFQLLHTCTAIGKSLFYHVIMCELSWDWLLTVQGLAQALSSLQHILALIILQWTQHGIFTTGNTLLREHKHNLLHQMNTLYRQMKYHITIQWEDETTYTSLCSIHLDSKSPPPLCVSHIFAQFPPIHSIVMLLKQYWDSAPREKHAYSTNQHNKTSPFTISPQDLD